jgi:hypothetical protein
MSSLPRLAAVVLAVSWIPLLGGGCAHYEYDLVEPPELARHVGKSEVVVPKEPLEYRMRTVENRLVIHVINPTDEPVTLIGQQSYIVSPGGQSHPLRPQTIAPHTFIPLILPPMRPYYYYPYYPTWGWGFGVVGVGGHFHGGGHHHGNGGGSGGHGSAAGGGGHGGGGGGHGGGGHRGHHRGGHVSYSVGVSSGFYDPFYYWPPYYGPPYYGPVYYMGDDETDPVYWEWKGETDVRVHLVFQRGTNARTFSDDFTFHRKKM